MRSQISLRLLIITALSLALLLPVAALAQQGALVTLQAPAAPPVVDATFTTDVTVSGAQGLLGFQFDINFDPAVLAVEAVELGPFLGSTGRAPRPLGPDQRAAAEGRVVYGGFTLGDQEGAGGDGLLATITWRSLAAGQSPTSLSRLQLAGSGGAALPNAVGDDLLIAVSEVGAATSASDAQPAEPQAETERPPGILLWGWGIVIVAVVIGVGLAMTRRSAPA